MSTQAAGQRLAERAVPRVKRQGQRIGLFLRHNHIVRKPAIAVNADSLKIAAQIHAVQLALVAAAAMNVRIAGDPRAERKSGDGAPHFLDDPAEFMA
jgi:hypothetical protein